MSRNAKRLMPIGLLLLFLFGCIGYAAEPRAPTFRPIVVAASGQHLASTISKRHSPIHGVPPGRRILIHTPSPARARMTAGGVDVRLASVRSFGDGAQTATVRFRTRGDWHLHFQLNCSTPANHGTVTYLTAFIVTQNGEPPSQAEATGRVINEGSDWDADVDSGAVEEHSQGTYRLLVHGCMGYWRVSALRG